MSRVTIPDSVRRIVAQRAIHRCEYCGIPEEDSFYTFQLDHIISLNTAAAMAYKTLLGHASLAILPKAAI